MATFYESENNPIASEMVRQGFILHRDEVLRIVDIDERAAGTDTAIAIGTAAISLVAACGTLALSGFTLPILAPIAALSFAGLTAWNSRVSKQERELEAEFLHSHPEFIEAVNQKLAAGEESDRVAAAYEHTLKAFIQGDHERLQRFLPDASVAPGLEANPETTAQPALPDPVQDQVQTTPAIAIGTNTRLGAVEVPAVAQPALTPLDEVREIANRNNSFYIAGSKGSGKGMFTANLLRWKLAQFPSAIALCLDPKGDTKESGYWRHERIQHYAFKGIALRPDEYEQKVIEFLATARQLISQCDVRSGKRLFIVVDEMLALKTKLSKPVFDELISFGTEAISTGDSEGIHFLAVTQSFNAGDSFGSDEVLKNLTLVGLFREDEFNRAKKVVSYGRVNTDSFSDAEFRSLVATSPVNRAMTIGGKFFPTPELENYSGYDRDSNQMVQEVPLGTVPSEGDLLAQQLQQEIAQKTEKSESKANVKKPDMPMKDIMLQCSLLAEWIEQTGVTDAGEIYQKWLSRKHGFSRPEIRYLLTLIQSDG